MQSEANPKEVYVAQTTKDPKDVVARYNAVENPKTLPKPLGNMLPLTLRLDLAGANNSFTSQTEATEYRKELSADFEKQKFTYELKSKRSYFFGRKKSLKDKQTGKYKLIIDPSLYQIDGSSREGTRLTRGEVYSYGRKKSEEWNDEVAAKFEVSLKEKLKKRLENTDN